VKRSLDLLCVLFGLAILWPLLLTVGFTVRILIGRPVFFRQVRPGMKGEPFVILKFRTMNETRDSRGDLLPDAQRLTRFGRFLRNTSLDELPELFNVLKGDMSIVGPRPLLMEYLPRYTAEQARRHEVRPGVTGWAQVNGRNNVSWERKFELDVWYVDHHTIWLDLKILALTLVRVLWRKGITAANHATMPPFEGLSAGSAQRVGK
jgi:lipopolysaccharide/colanic/teichoic acid biosynthesis glycosyltransferase